MFRVLWLSRSVIEDAKEAIDQPLPVFILAEQDIMRRKELADFKNEIRTLRSLRNPYIVQYIGVIIDNGTSS